MHIAMLLDENEDTLEFTIADGEAIVNTLLTNREKDIYTVAEKLGRFSFTELVKKANTTNKKAVASMLRKAGLHGVVRQEGGRYIWNYPGPGRTA